MGMFSKACVLGLVAAAAASGCVGEEGASPSETGVLIVTPEDMDQTKVVDVPPELSFSHVEKADDGVGTLACRVTLLYCRDPRFTPRIPSYCHNADCGEDQAERNARNLCRDNCGSNVNCSGLVADIHPCP